MAADPPFIIDDLRGGVNNTDSPTKIADNQVVDARNVDLRDGALGSKRRGTAAISMTSAAFNSAVITLIRHTPSGVIASDELWGIDANGNIDRRVAGVWQGGVTKVNTTIILAANDFQANGVSLHGKLFLALSNTQDRLLVWDGTVLRWAGFWQTPVPTVADTAVAGAYTGTRYFRTRYIQMSGSTVLRRSEPSTTVTFTPSGANTGAVITKAVGTEAAGSIYKEAQTHWEVEGSTDGTLFYLLATVVIGTATYTDTAASSTYSANRLSEDIGEYVPPALPRHLAVDEDRIVMGGSRVVAANESRVAWTPVEADDGVGNDERVPTATLQYLNFDGNSDGVVTGLVGGVNNYVYVFKRSRIYKMGRTGDQAAAYEPISVTATRGCLPRCAVGGTDPSGVPCVYFLDPSIGLCRYGQRGMEDRLGESVRKTWRTRNRQALIQARLLFYEDLDQVWYSVATGVATTPNLMFMHESRYGSNWFHDGVLATAQAMVVFPNTTTDTLRPWLGMASTASSYIHEADTGVTDAGTAFLAYVTTKPYALGALWQKFGLMAAVLLARAATGTTLRIRLTRNFGIETRDVTADLTPSAAAESHVIRPLDNASMSELNVVQLTFGDEAADAQEWSLDQFSAHLRPEEPSA